MDSANTAIGRAQALLDPTGQGLFTAQRLMPYLNIAYASLRDEAVASRMVTASEAVVVLPGVPAGTKDLSVYVAPGGVLQSLAAPLSVREKPAGAGDEEYTEVARVDELPAREPDGRLREYEWRGGNVYFIGATEPLDLEVRFEQIWPVIQTPSQALGAIGIANILGFWTAGLMCVAMREAQLGAGYVAEARHQLFVWIQRQVMDSQHVTRRPRPYNPPEGGGFNGGSLAL
jgi:hypothetical protein